MIHKFESWRTYRQASVANQCTMMHYYRLEDDSLRVVLRLLKAIVSQRVQKGRNSLYLSVSDDECNVILSLIEQVKFGYIHPRSTSARYSFLSETRSVANSLATPRTY